jgi:hypothetical protein
MTHPIIETVSFQLANGVSESAFKAEIPASTAFIKARAGFVARRLSCGEDGRWLDHIEWKSLADAQAASEAFMQEPSLMGFAQCIDMDTAEMRHQVLELTEG